MTEPQKNSVKRFYCFKWFSKKVSINRTQRTGLMCIFSRWPSVKPSTYYYVFMVGFTRYKCISNIYENGVSESSDHIFIHLW